MDYKALKFRWGGADTLRYHGFRMLMQDTVGHHSHNVISILLAIKPNASRELILAAHDHDVAEHIVGDLPAPTKRNMGIRERFAEYEAEVMGGAGIPDPEASITDEEKVFLKLADSMDGMRFCLNERQLGNMKIAHVFLAFASYVQALLPETGRATTLFNKLVEEWEIANGTEA